MALSFCVLGSGSSGNSTVLALHGGSAVAPSLPPAGRPAASQPTAPPAGPARYVLIDAGLSPRMTARRLAPLGLAHADISDIFLTHLDHDHFRPTWLKIARTHGIRIHLHRRHRARLLHENDTVAGIELFDGPIDLDGQMKIETIPLAHDALGTVGFVIEHAGCRLGFATDLGRVPPSLLERFTGLHGLALESNYDRRMQIASPRPAMLKKRIMGGNGHLSNEEALEAILRIDGRSALSHVALLHLSRQCNCPRLIARLWSRRAPHLLDRLTLTNQTRPTPMLRVTTNGQTPPPRPAEQLAMF